MQHKLRRFKAGCFQALAHPTRIAVVELLSEEGEVSVTRIYERLGVEQANASQHLAVLRSRQIVTGRKDGNQVHEIHPSIRFGLAFPLAPGIILVRHEYQLAGLYGWGGWELHAWYIVGTRPIFGMTQWIS